MHNILYVNLFIYSCASVSLIAQVCLYTLVVNERQKVRGGVRRPVCRHGWAKDKKGRSIRIHGSLLFLF